MGSSATELTVLTFCPFYISVMTISWNQEHQQKIAVLVFQVKKNHPIPSSSVLSGLTSTSLICRSISSSFSWRVIRMLDRQSSRTWIRTIKSVDFYYKGRGFAAAVAQWYSAGGCGFKSRVIFFFSLFLLSFTSRESLNRSLKEVHL